MTRMYWMTGAALAAAVTMTACSGTPREPDFSHGRRRRHHQRRGGRLDAEGVGAVTRRPDRRRPRRFIAPHADVDRVDRPLRKRRPHLRCRGLQRRDTRLRCVGEWHEPPGRCRVLPSIRCIPGGCALDRTARWDRGRRRRRSSRRRRPAASTRDSAHPTPRPAPASRCQSRPASSSTSTTGIPTTGATPARNLRASAAGSGSTSSSTDCAPRTSAGAYNGKRGNLNDLSLDIIDYHYGAGESFGSTQVYIIDVLLQHCGSNPTPTWIDQTGVTAAANTIGRWGYPRSGHAAVRR